MISGRPPRHRTNRELHPEHMSNNYSEDMWKAKWPQACAQVVQECGNLEIQTQPTLVIWGAGFPGTKESHLDYS